MTEERQEQGRDAKRPGLLFLCKPVQSVASGQLLQVAARSVASVGPKVVVKAKVLMLPRVWAVADDSALPRGESVELAEVVPFPAVMEDADQELDEDESPLQQYRRYTEGMLRRYLRLSTEAGRVPSLLGRELFHGNVTSYKVTSFEDVVIFCHDMEKCLERLRPVERLLIKRITLQEYSQKETASMLRMSRRKCVRGHRSGLDRLTVMLLAAKMMKTMESLKCCQVAGPFTVEVSDSLEAA